MNEENEKKNYKYTTNRPYPILFTPVQKHRSARSLTALGNAAN